MRVRAIIFDVYATLLEVGPPPPDVEEPWQALWSRLPGKRPALLLSEFTSRCEAIIRREHTAARARGIAWPEVYWPEVAAEVIPMLRELPGTERDDWLYEQAQVARTVGLAPGAGEALRSLDGKSVQLGIASNAQAYTLRELDAALAGAGLSRQRFEADLCFWSFEHGFSKPDPHVFQILGSRFCARGIGPDEVLMVGDRLDNDIEPALRGGWRAWHLQRIEEVASSAGPAGDSKGAAVDGHQPDRRCLDGGWTGLAEFLAGVVG